MSCKGMPASLSMLHLNSNSRHGRVMRVCVWLQLCLRPCVCYDGSTSCNILRGLLMRLGEISTHGFVLLTERSLLC